jgi:small subunit ribosomal protein S17
MINMAKIEIKNIGIETRKPEKTPKSVDPKDPFHGSVKLRGRIFTGIVTSSKMQKTVTVEWPRKTFNSKYERFEVRRTRVKAHNPESIDAREGDTVRIAETRPLSKTKNFVVIEIVKKYVD